MNLRNALLALALAAMLPSATVHAEPFTFQGFLEQAGTPLNGSANLAFKLYDAQSAGSQIGTTLTANAWPVAAGVFSIDLDFTSVVFTGAPRWLQVEVNGTPLSGRIAVQPAPLAASANALRGFNVLGSTPSSGQVLKWNGTAWAPAAESGGSSYSAGNGLTLSGTTFSVDFAGSGAANTASRSDHDHFGQTWSGTSSGHGLYILNSETTGSPTGIFGVEGAGTNTGAGVRGLSSNGTGVSGQGVTGVYGHTLDPSGKGVWGFGGASGVLGESEGVAGIGVHGRALHASGLVSGVRGDTTSSLGSGVQGNNTSTSGGSGVYGLSAAALGRGVLGVNQATTGDAAGVYGQTASGAGYGVVGSNTGVTGSGAGVRGEGQTGVEAEGTQYGLVASTTGGDDAAAVRAVALHPTAHVSAVNATVNAPGGYAVYAVNEGTSGNAYGVAAATGSSGGTAIYGLAPGGASGSPIGVRGETGAGGGYGLYGVNTATAAPAIALGAVSSADGGVAAEIRAQGAGNAKAIDALSSGTGGTAHALRARLTNAASTGDAIYAYANSASAKAARLGNSSGTAVTLAGGTTALEATGNAIIAGDLGVFGTLSKGGGSFKIDHPLDPANQFLLHSFVESPDMMNVYNGNIVTDARGYATIELPEWFEALNRDFRYQLTVIGTFAQAIVSKKVEHNRFEIRSSQPGVEVSWQVTGIRRDAWAEKHRIPVEVQKAPAERGKYLHPELYGAPAGKRIGVPPSGK